MHVCNNLSNHADLNHAYLNHADLNHADLNHADLNNADLSHAVPNHEPCVIHFTKLFDYQQWKTKSRRTHALLLISTYH